MTRNLSNRERIERRQRMTCNNAPGGDPGEKPDPRLQRNLVMLGAGTMFRTWTEICFAV